MRLDGCSFGSVVLAQSDSQVACGEAGPGGLDAWSGARGSPICLLFLCVASSQLSGQASVMAAGFQDDELQEGQKLQVP